MRPAMAIPEPDRRSHRNISGLRYGTLQLDDIMALPVARVAAETCHLYIWCPNALLPEGLGVMRAWGFKYKSNIVWHKISKDGGSDGRGVGFYFRNVTDVICLVCAETTPAHSNPGALRSTLRAESGNTRESRTSSTDSSRRAAARRT